MKTERATCFDERLRLQTKAGMCEYLRISSDRYDKWHAEGRVPGPLRGTNLYDVRAHDRAIDHWSGLDASISELSPLEKWERAREGL